MSDKLQDILNSIEQNQDYSSILKEAMESSDDVNIDSLTDEQLEAIAQKVATKLAGVNKEEEGTDKVASFVEEINEQMEKAAEATDYVVSTLANYYLFDGEAESSEDIVKIAEEDEDVAYALQGINAFANQADEMLHERYGDDYELDDVVKLAAVLIENAPEIEENEEVEEYEADEEDFSDEEMKLAEEILQELYSNDELDPEFVKEALVQGVAAGLRNAGGGLWSKTRNFASAAKSRGKKLPGSVDNAIQNAGWRIQGGLQKATKGKFKRSAGRDRAFGYGATAAGLGVGGLGVSKATGSKRK